MKIGYPDTMNKQSSGDCCGDSGSPLHASYTPEIHETSYPKTDWSGLAAAAKKIAGGNTNTDTKKTT